MASLFTGAVAHEGGEVLLTRPVHFTDLDATLQVMLLLSCSAAVCALLLVLCCRSSRASVPSAQSSDAAASRGLSLNARLANTSNSAYGDGLLSCAPSGTPLTEQRRGKPNGAKLSVSLASLSPQPERRSHGQPPRGRASKSPPSGGGGAAVSALDDPAAAATAVLVARLRQHAAAAVAASSRASKSPSPAAARPTPPFSSSSNHAAGGLRSYYEPNRTLV